MDSNNTPALLARLAESAVPETIDVWPGIRTRVTARQNRKHVGVRPAIVGAGATAIALVAIALVSLPVTSNVDTVSAETLMDRAQTATSALTYHMLLTRRPVAKSSDTVTAEVWFAGADRQRSTQQTRDAGGGLTETSDWVFNGADAWLASTTANHTTVIHTVGTEWTRPADDPSATRNLLYAFQRYSDAKTCLSAQIVQGEATIAGRSAYLVRAMPKPDCRVAGGSPQMQAWIDQATYLPLKTEVRDAAGALLDASEVTSLQVGVAIPEAMFTYAVPAGAEVHTFNGGTGADVKRALAGPSNEPMTKPKR